MENEEKKEEEILNEKEEILDFTDSVKAGTYTGYMDFYIEVIDK